MTALFVYCSMIVGFFAAAVLAYMMRDSALPRTAQSAACAVLCLCVMFVLFVLGGVVR